MAGAVPSSFRGPTYVAIWTAQVEALGDANGLGPMPDAPAPLKGGLVSRLSNGQAVALVQAWRQAAARSRVNWPLWVDLNAYALGAREPGQRFRMDRAHRKARLPDDAAAMLWATLAQLAIDLDDSSTVVRPIVVEWTDAAYERGARDTWEAMKRDLDQAEELAPSPATTPEGDTVDASKIPVPEWPPKLPDEWQKPIDEVVVPIITDPLKPVRSAAATFLVVLLVGFGVYTYAVTRAVARR